MKLTAPIDIMMDCCIPDRKKLMLELSKLSPGEVLQVKIDSCVTSQAIVENYVKNHLCRIVKVVEHDDWHVLHIRFDVQA
jgi:TusA-related sulfurtransferase